MTIRNTLTKTFGRNYHNFKGEIGLEIETETLQEYKVPQFSFWDVHNDGSLRNVGREYVLRQPLEITKEFPEAMVEFASKTKDIKFIPDSITTSVHVHLNMLNETFVTLGNFLTLYTLVENLLVRYSGEDRKSNLFCLPICDAEEIYNNIMSMMRGIGGKKYAAMQFAPENTKYGALNLAALVQYGSLEIRSFRGTTDIGVIKKWVDILYSILKYARQDKLVPPQIIMAYKEKGPELLTDVFGEFREEIRQKEEDKLIEKNFWYAASIAYSIRNWDKLEDIPKPKKAKPKDLEAISQSMYQTTFEALNFDQQQNVIQAVNEIVQAPAPTATDTVRVDRNPFVDYMPTGLRRTAATGIATATGPLDFTTRDVPRAPRLDDRPDWVIEIQERLDRGREVSNEDMELFWQWQDERNDAERDATEEELR